MSIVRRAWRGLRGSWLHGAFAVLLCGVIASPAAASGENVSPGDVPVPPVTRGVELQFPRDEGSHPAYLLEWWYVTGWLEPDDKVRRPQGFQVTFFRVRMGAAEDNPSRFAMTQVLFGHAALADPETGKLRHSQRSARAGFGLAYANEGRTDVRLDDWSIVQAGDGLYRTAVRGEDFEFRLDLRATQPPLLQGDRGWSQKGPDPRAASYYYSLPQLAVSGTVVVDGRERKVTGSAWFDHEWSSDFVDPRAQGWDWLGVNLHDGGALMAFRMRDGEGREHWAAATLQSPHPRCARPLPQGERCTEGSRVTTYAPDAVEWTPLASWRSPRTGAEHPIRWRVRVGDATYRVEPLMEDAELDSRASTGVLYWEGPVRLVDDASGRELGRGYLELTGYGGKLDL